MLQPRVARAVLVFSIAWLAALGDVGAVGAASPADELAEQIHTQVQQSLKAPEGPVAPSASVVEFEALAVSAAWKELWPDAQGGMVRRDVTGKIWNASIRAALAKYGAVFLPKREQPYYLNEPIVLQSGQRLLADREAEIRLVPDTDTCMVRNAHIVSGQNEPIPDATQPDTQIVVEGGIWTTLATGGEESNGNEHGWPVKGDTSIHCHGVILLSNVRGVAVRNLVIRQSRVHAVQLSNCREFLVEGVTFEEHRRDGIHVNGPASYGVIRDIRGVTGDDFVALNAWDWSNTVPSFGAIHHVLVENIFGNPQGRGTDEMRLLPGTKTFADGRKLDCPVADCVFRNLHDIRTFKVYDQPNLELGREKDFSDPVGTVRNVYFERLVFHRPGCFQIAANVAGLSIDDVELRFDVNASAHKDFKLVAIGPMSQTCRIVADDPATWVELFSPDCDVTIRGFRLGRVGVPEGDGSRPLPDAAARLVQVTDQKPNPDYPKTTPRGGTGKALIVDD